MKTHLKLLTLCLSACLFLTCKQHIPVKTDIENGFPRFTILTANESSPVIIAGDHSGNSGSVFFETITGKTWIKGKPEKSVTNDSVYLFKWNMDGREITGTFQHGISACRFSFTAKPDSGILKWGINIEAAPDEYFTGLFERTVDGNQTESWKQGIREGMNMRGQELDMIIKPTLSLYCPFYLSSAGYGLFFEGTWPGHYDICKSDTELVKIEFEGPSLSGILYSAGHPADIVKAHALHVGPTVVPPQWAFLPWRWRDNHTNNKIYYDGTPEKSPYNSMLTEDILIMKALDIPCGVYWVDRPWAKGVNGYDDFDWDPGRFPNADKMISWLHENNTRFLLWIAPWVSGEMKNFVRTSGYDIPLKGPHGGLDSSTVAELDFTNPAARKWWQENGIEKMLKQGVDGFKLDRSEELFPETRSIIAFDGRTSREVRNDYPVLYVKTVNESCRKIRGEDFVLIPRAGYTGSSKYSGFWGGDIGSPAEGLRTAIIAIQKSAVIGFPVWGSDIGGYWQGDLDREICARWLAFGCFNPIMEFGPTEDRAPWDMRSEPHYDTTLIAIWRMYANLHTALASYSYNLVRLARETGMPPVRPLFLEFPDQKQAWDNWETFMYGPDILVKAIWEKGTTTCSCYLPSGCRWTDAWDTTKTYDGGQTVTIETPLHKIPLFIREGSAVKPGNLLQLYRESLEIAKTRPNLKALEKKYLH